MKNIFLKKLFSLFFVLALAVFIFPLVSSAQFGPDDDPGDCAFYDVGSDVWYAQGCDLIPTSGGPTTTGGGGGGGSSGGSGSCALSASPKFNNLVDYVVCIINFSVIPLVFSLAFMLFVYGVVQYVLNDADGAKRQQGKQFMLWGIIALTVMVSVWGLVRLLGGSFGLNTSVIPQVSTN